MGKGNYGPLVIKTSTTSPTAAPSLTLTTTLRISSFHTPTADPAASSGVGQAMKAKDHEAAIELFGTELQTM